MGVRGGGIDRDSSPADRAEAAANDAAVEQAGLRALYDSGLLKEGQNPLGSNGVVIGEMNDSDEGPSIFQRRGVDVDGQSYLQIKPNEYNPESIAYARRMGFDIAPIYHPEHGLLVNQNQQAQFVNATANRDPIAGWADRGGLFNLLAGSFLAPTALADIYAAATTGGVGSVTANGMAAGNIPMDPALYEGVKGGFLPDWANPTVQSTSAAPAAPTEGSEFWKTDTTGLNVPTEGEIVQPGLAEPPGTPGASTASGSSIYDKVTGGIKSLVSPIVNGINTLSEDTGIPKGLLTAGLGAIAGTVVDKVSGGDDKKPTGTGTGGGGYMTTGVNYSQVRNPKWSIDKPNEPYFIQSYTPGTTTKLAARGGLMEGIGGLKQYAAGGKLLRGPGDGLSDDIPANIDGVQEARLADGEFVVPADVVSALGGGSTEAGSRKLYAMLDRVRQQAHGHTKQIRKVSDKVLPA